MKDLQNPAILFLKHYLELQGMMHPSDSWDEKYLENNPPRCFRLKRMNACMKALGFEIHDWANLKNNFLQLVLNLQAKKQLEEVLASQFDLEYDSYVCDEDNLNPGHLFNMLLDIRIATFQLSVIRDSVLAASDHYITPLLVIRKLEEKIESDNAALDEAIAILLNPNTILLTLEELKTCFDYPDVDLDEIDLDWI